jgi:hypothetical protein
MAVSMCLEMDEHMTSDREDRGEHQTDGRLPLGLSIPLLHGEIRGCFSIGPIARGFVINSVDVFGGLHTGLWK